ncbi:MAG TPA: glycosyltransferase, partial [Rectinemataceae bacterium]|nr:glycosyltransferase [Rectinemataceae bacterium]
MDSLLPSAKKAQREIPLFTILTPTYNRARILPALKASLDSQSFSDFEWLIVDDGSVDGTADLAAAWIETSGYPIRVLSCPN